MFDFLSQYQPSGLELGLAWVFCMLLLFAALLWVKAQERKPHQLDEHATNPGNHPPVPPREGPAERAPDFVRRI